MSEKDRLKNGQTYLQTVDESSKRFDLKENMVLLLTSCGSFNHMAIWVWKEQYTYYLLVMGWAKMSLSSTIDKLTLLLMKLDTAWTPKLQLQISTHFLFVVGQDT